ncbi:MAG: metal-dependent transcriptional regulator [Desulfosarcina sp.]|jgi:DtxR family Mn-dependent transcriptional regulator
MQSHSQTVEDYLKAIYVLQEKEGVAKTGALARHLAITAGSVTEMIKRMAGMSPALVVYRQHHGVSLTGHGKQAAMAVIRRHRLLETFLYQTLALGWEAVHEEAETLEHHLSERLVGAIDRHLGHPCVDPHGEPIPEATGRMHPPAGEPLTALDIGATFRVVRVDPSINDMLAYLDNLGIGLETTGVVLDQAPFGGPLTLQLTDSDPPREAAIGREVADHIFGVVV